MDQTFANRSAKMDDKCPPLQLADPKELLDISNSKKRKRSSPTASSTAAGPSTSPDDKGKIPAGPSSSTYHNTEDKSKVPASSSSLQAPQRSSTSSEEAQWKLRAERAERREKLLEKKVAALQQKCEANEKESQDLRRQLMNALKRAADSKCWCPPTPSEGAGLSGVAAWDIKSISDKELPAFLRNTRLPLQWELY